MRAPLDCSCPSAVPAVVDPVKHAGPDDVAHQSPIREEVEGDECGGQHPLNVPGETWRIEHSDQVMGEEAAAVACLTGKVTEVVLERRERTDAVRDLDPASPGESGYVHE